MKSIEVKNDKVDALSDCISNVVNSYVCDTKFEGAFINCFANGEGLSSVYLELVYCDYRFDADKHSIDGIKKVIDNTGVNVVVEAIPYWQFGGELPNKFLVEQLKSSNIIYDRKGNLTERKRLLMLDEKIEDFGWRGAVYTEPAIQYKKQ